MLRKELVLLASLLLLAGVDAVNRVRTLDEARPCSCYARAHVGFRDASCECLTNPSGVFGLLSEFLDLGSAAVPANQSCSCAVDVGQGYNNGKCTCSADVVPCPENSAGHPFCVPNKGYSGVIVWDAVKLQYNLRSQAGEGLTKLSQASCPGNSTGWPDCTCVSGFYGTLTWVPETTSYSGTCKLATCPDGSDSAPSCTCKKGFKETKPVTFLMTTAAWTGECTKQDCPTNAIAETFSDCSCKLGFQGSTKWSGSAWIDGCSLADCPSRASHTGAVCKCNQGYFDADSDKVNFNFTSQAWAGSCEVRSCPANSEGHPNCACKKAYLGTLVWNPVSQDYDGVCSRAPCPDGGVGDNCACQTGYVSDPLDGSVWQDRVGWRHTCTVKGCPTGSNVANPTACKCDLPGYSGSLSWNGQVWGSCSEVACPENSRLDNPTGRRSCTCNIGFGGAVTWSSDTVSWLSTCKAVPCPVNAICGPVNATCVKGYKGTVVWNPANQVWDSTCQAVTCPANAGKFPDCECDAGSAGGDKNGVLTWVNNGDNSRWASGCTIVDCPEHASKNADKSCSCDFGYTGTITWNRPVYEGSCPPAPCPVNATGNGPTCACPKGFLPSADFAFRAGKWIGTCDFQSCGNYVKDWPNCRCIDGAYYADGRTSISWSATTGYSGSCILWQCPSDASPVGVCNCNKGYAAYISGSQVSVSSSWNTAGYWDHDCRKVNCPSGSNVEEHPNCQCRVGYSGRPEWNSKTGLWTPCIEVPCNEGANLVRGTGAAASQCVCKVGYVGSVSWNTTTQVWDGQCTLAPCPPNALCSGSEAACSKGYTGKVTWAGTSWESTCTAVPCPANSTGFPDCRCRVGWAGGMLSWDGAVYGTCTYVQCPANSDRLESGQCVCKYKYSGFPTWTGNSYSGNCTLGLCPANGGSPPDCKCVRAYKPSADFGWSNVSRSWQGTCDPAPCPANSIAKERNCTCQTGFAGTITWNDVTAEFSGLCIQAPCPDFSATSDNGCYCMSGYMGVPTWDGLTWSHNCTPQACAPDSTQYSLGSKGYTCTCNVPFRGNPIWGGTKFTDECREVKCPAHSKVAPGDPSTCICNDGFKGDIKWKPTLQSYDSYCAPVNCPAPSRTSGDTCACPPGYTGSCSWKVNDWECNCAPQDCPANAYFHTDQKFCTCNTGYTGKLTWDDVNDEYGGNCTKVTCESGVPNSSGHPKCACNVGFAGTVQWDDDNDLYFGSCPLVACPQFSDNHPKCSCIKAYRARNAKTDPVRWNAGTQSWDGGCEPIPCPANAGNNPPNCDCVKGYAPNNLVVVGDAWSGSCDAVSCPNKMGTHPDCNCTRGYSNYIYWNATAYNYKSNCAPVPCPPNASGEPVCECDDGYKNEPTWDGPTQTWTHTCAQVSCPENSAGHPRCECTSGYTGTITWDRPTRMYNGKCNMVPCPAGSKRRSTQTNAKALIIGCQCFTGCAGGYDWLTTQYTGGCTCKPCPATGDCSALKQDPSTNTTAFPCVKGYTGSVNWDGENWVDNCVPLACPANSEGHPSCFCSVGYKGNVTFSSSWDGTTTSAQYTSSCTFVACPDVTMTRSKTPQGLPQCICQVGFAGTALWNTGNQVFDGASVCKEVPCTDSRMTKDDTLSQCTCPVNFVGKSSWVPENQLYQGERPTCILSNCPGGATCDSNPNLRKCNTYYTGFYSWDMPKQVWAHNCSVAECPANSKKVPLVNNVPQGCVCTTGYTKNPNWKDATQSFDGCDVPAPCPANTDSAKDDTGASLCNCLPGYSGQPAWNTSLAAYTHTCTQVPCTPGSIRGENNLCNCDIGYNGTLTWDAVDQFYKGRCQLAPCSGAGLDCKNSGDRAKRDPVDQLPCFDGYDLQGSWSASTQTWINQCVLVDCPSKSVRTSDSTCECVWGFTGKPTWDTKTRKYSGACVAVPCVAPSSDTGDGHCICPPSTQNGTCDFLASDVWSCNCGPLVACQGNSSGSVSCKCNVGYKGNLDTAPVVTIKDAPQTTSVQLQTSRTGSCVAVPCPENSLDGSFPTCSCASGYQGNVTWDDSSSSWVSTCAVAKCPANSSKGPACGCNKGYLGTPKWNFATQQWDGTCDLAACPANATSVVVSGVPSCPCDVGFRGIESWNAIKGWTHSCEYIACPSMSSKVTNRALRYTKISNFAGCQLDGTSLGLIGRASTILGQDQDCIDGSEACVALGQQACELLVTQGNECWGYAVNAGSPVQVYSSLAVNKTVCSGDTGLLASTGWVTYQRQVLRVGDCRCVDGYRGKFIWQGSDYAGSCELATCPSNAACTTTVLCNKGYKGSTAFVWNFNKEQWDGSCVAQACPANTRADTFPDCNCGLGYKGSYSWDFPTESFKGSCSAVDCPANSDNNFPTCKCNRGYVRSDGSANSVIGWNFDTQLWRQTCNEVPCPSFSNKVSTGDCSCRIGYRGKPTFDFSTATYIVNESGDFNSCKLVDCPANSVRVGTSCQCMDGWKGDLSWDPSSYTWGDCTIVDCPAHSRGHPHCACNEGYYGALNWVADSFVGTCLELTSTPTWTSVTDFSDTNCVRLQGPRDTLGSAVDGPPTEFTLMFGGKSDVDVSVIRCEIKLDAEFTKVRGSFVVSSIATASVKTVSNNFAIMQWNSSAVTPQTSFIAFGTPYSIVDPGREQGSNALSYTTAKTITIPESTVTQSNILRFEISQPSGVQLSVSGLNLSTYNLPGEIVKCTRTSSTTTTGTR